jgi:hypothetical protein
MKIGTGNDWRKEGIEIEYKARRLIEWCEKCSEKKKDILMSENYRFRLRSNR